MVRQNYFSEIMMIDMPIKQELACLETSMLLSLKQQREKEVHYIQFKDLPPSTCGLLGFIFKV